MSELNRIIHQAIGEASMCWEKPEGAGVFQSSEASDIAVRLIADLKAVIEGVMPETWEACIGERVRSIGWNDCLTEIRRRVEEIK